MNTQEKNVLRKEDSSTGLEVPPEHWGPWLVSILEELQTKATGDKGLEAAFDQALDRVQLFLEDRLVSRLLAQWEEAEQRAASSRALER